MSKKHNISTRFKKYLEDLRSEMLVHVMILLLGLAFLWVIHGVDGVFFLIF